MSADNWAVCPRCEATRQTAINQAQADLDASYGQVSLEEFDGMRAALKEKREERVPSTFREDWEIGLYCDEFYVDYRGRCSECGLAYKFNHTEALTERGAS